MRKDARWKRALEFERGSKKSVKRAAGRMARAARGCRYSWAGAGAGIHGAGRPILSGYPFRREEMEEVLTEGNRGRTEDGRHLPKRISLTDGGEFRSEGPACQLLRYLPFLLFKKNPPDPNEN